MDEGFGMKSIKFIVSIAFISMVALNPSYFYSNTGKEEKVDVVYSQLSGFVKKDGDTYYYSPITGQKVTGLQTIDGYRYYFSSTGRMQTGLRTINGYKYYFSKTTGKSLSGLREVDGYRYYFSKTTGKALSGLREIDGSKYYFSTTTFKSQSGLRTLSGEKYYFSKTSGKALSGLRAIDGYKYYFSTKTKKALSGLRVINGDKYYFSTITYKAQTGLRFISEERYYFSKTSGKALSGLREIDGSKYYFSPETKAALNGFITIDNNTYCFDKYTDKMLFGIHIIDGKYYEFNEETGVLVEDENISGIVYKNSEPYFYINEDGTSETGMVTVDNERYYFVYGGGIYKGFRTINNKLYYFSEEDGKAAKGITEIEGESYYFHPTYSYALGGLHSIWENTYYFSTSNYQMMKNYSVQIGYLVFKTDENGLVTSVKAATGYENNKRANALIEGFKLIGTPYGSADNQLMCNRFAAEVLLAAGNKELVKYGEYTNNMYYKPVEEQAEYVLTKGYNKNMNASNLKPGDLIFWDYGANGPIEHRFTFNGTNYCIGHVSVYLGDGLIMEATGSTWDGGSGHTRVTTFDPSDAKPTYNPIIYASLLP